MKNIQQRVSLKKIKVGFGHDLAGMFAEFYLDGKKMGYFNDDGYGGETEINFISPQHEKTFEYFLESNNIAEFMFTHQWNFLNSIDEITIHNQICEVVNYIYNCQQIDKEYKKVVKLCDTGIYYSSPQGFRGLEFKHSLIEMVKNKTYGLPILQKSYDKLKQEVLPGHSFVNTNLKELGIKL
jgi:hypothetical protein